MWSADDSSAGGGGFLDQTYNGQSTQPNKSDPVRGSAVVPLMIGHLLDNRPDDLNLWGTPVKLISFVAYVRKFERVTTKISYELVDETGSIMAFQWIEGGDTKGPVTIPAGSYARVVGSPREQGDTRHLFILKIMPVNSFSEVFEHLLEVTFLCLKGKELLSEGGEADTKSPSKEDFDMESCRGMNKEQAAVFRVIRMENETDTGIERSKLRIKLPQSLATKLDRILEFLVSEGHIYTTCTDDHFKTT